MSWGLLAGHSDDAALAVAHDLAKSVDGQASPGAQSASKLRSAGRFLADARRLAGRLSSAPAGAESGSRVDALVACRDRYHFAVAIYAAWMRGWAVALPPNVQPALLAQWLERPEVGCLIHDTDESAGTDMRPILEADHPPICASGLEDPNHFAADRRIVAVWTSGTTGEHQRHDKTAGQLLGEAGVLARQFGISSSSTIVATVPPHHIYGLLFSVLVPLVSGARFHRESPLHAQAVAAPLRGRSGITLVSVPAHLRILSVLEAGELAGVERVFSSGAPLHEATARMLAERFERPATEILGSTETGGIAYRVRDGRSSDWHPLPGVECIVGEDERLAIRSPFVDPSLPQPYSTPERVRARPGGRGAFEHLGRIDGVIKVGGKRISSAEVEARLLAIAGVLDAGVTHREVAGSRGSELLAAVVAPGKTAADIRSALAPYLEPVVLPRRIRLLDSLPRDANGKLKRADLLELFAPPDAESRHFVYVGEAASWRAQAQSGRVTIGGRVPNGFVACRGHFELGAVVPAASILSEVRRLAGLCFADLAPLTAVDRCKFRRPLRPGQQFTVALELRPPEQLRARWLDAEGELASVSARFASSPDERGSAS